MREVPTLMSIRNLILSVFILPLYFNYQLPGYILFFNGNVLVADYFILLSIDHCYKVL